MPSSDDIKDELLSAMGEDPGIGVVVGVIDDRGVRVISHGTFDRDDKRRVDGDTIFEVGSISKVFTALMLGDMVSRGEVKLDDRLDRYLPKGVTSPKRDGKSITLVDLATHTSGLPRLPTNLAPANRRDPYADYTPDRLYAFLASYMLPRDIGSQYEYSNLGVGLLGHALALRAGGEYGDVLRDRVTQPLGMSNTAVVLSPAMQARLAPGHNGELERVPGWHMGSLEGAGAVHSSVNDLLKLLRTAMGDPSSLLADAMAITLATQRPIEDSEGKIALAWHVDPESRGGMVWHNGTTGGYSSFMGYLPMTRTGVVVLSNVRPVIGVDDIGRRLLMSGMMSATEPESVPRSPIALPPELLDRYVGKYQLSPEFILTVTREGNYLYVQATDQDRFQVYANSEHEFFYTVVDAQISFVAKEAGIASGLVLHQGGREMRAERLR